MIFVISLSHVSATNVTCDNVGVGVCCEDIPVQFEDNSIQAENILYVDETDSDWDLVNQSECSSVVLHVSDTEGVISFRRDSTDSADLSIVEESYGGLTFVKQYKTSGGYFYHCMVSNNGWITGTGGIMDGNPNMVVESIVKQMILENSISDSYMRRLYDMFASYSIGHFLIKAPDGSFGIIFPTTYFTGKLSPGEYLVAPNVYSKYKRGSFDLNSDLVNSAIHITSSDPYGVNRRNIMTYHYNVAYSDNHIAPYVECFASNDNGRNVGLSTAGLVDNVYYFGNYHSRNTIPQTPGKLHLGTHTFSRTNKDVFKVINPTKTVLLGENIDLEYEFNYIYMHSPVVNFNIPSTFSINSVSLSKGFYTYDSNTRILSWHLPGAEEVNNIIISLKADAIGKSTFSSYIQNKGANYNFDLYVIDYGVKLSAVDVTKYYGNSKRYNVYLKDSQNNNIVGEKLSININGVTYDRQTNENGLASLPLNLLPNNYTIHVKYNGRFGSDSLNNTVNILSTVDENYNLTKYYKNATQYSARFKDTNGNILTRQNVTFNINGVFYTRQTNSEGFAKLNINLLPDEYIITAINQNNERISNHIKVLSVLEENNNLTKYYRNNSQYSIKVLDGNGNPLSNADVTFNINGVFYTRSTNDSGYAKLNINLLPDTYIITADYNGFKLANTIVVLPVLFSQDSILNVSNNDSFNVRLIDGNALPFENQNISFSIMDEEYVNVTDAGGIAKIHLNLVDGEYIINSYYNGSGISNRITIIS